MHNSSAKIAILLNGPPRVGKDTASEVLAAAIDAEVAVIKFTKPVKDMTHARFGLVCEHDAYEVLKDTPLREFGGLTPRQAYIETSDRLKAERGPDAVAQLFVEAMMASTARVIINPDLGFDFEAQAVVDQLGADKVVIIRISCEGHDFSSDCRGWVHLPGVESYDVQNAHGRPGPFLARIIEIGTSFEKESREERLRKIA